MDKLQCFISHCSDDLVSVEKLGDILRDNYDADEYQFFNTSKEEFSTKAGKGLSPQLREALNESEIMISLVTDSYIRSEICIAELSSFWFMDKPVIPLVYSIEGEALIKRIMGDNTVFIKLYKDHPYNNNDNKKSGPTVTDAENENGDIKKSAQKLVKSLIDFSFVPKNENRVVKAFENMFSNVEQAIPQRAYIGSNRIYKRINSYCNEAGIIRITGTNLDDRELKRRLIKSRRIYIVSTTGNNLISKLAADFIPEALAHGTDFYVFVPNRNSSFISDVAEIEDPKDKPANEKRFERQFDEVVYNLKGSIKKVRGNNPEGTGDVYLGCTYNLLRQTITLAEYEDGSVWGWMSLTIPPNKTIGGGTPSIEFEGGKEDNSLAANVYNHIISLREIAESRGRYISLASNSEFEYWNTRNTSSEKTDIGRMSEDCLAWAYNYEEAKQYWEKKNKEAIHNMSMKTGGMELIEVAAQHPLRSDGTPGREFAKRLDYAAELYSDLMNQGSDVKIYIPGSVHCYKGKQDKCSLSAAGTKYLIDKGIPEENLIGEDANLKYKGRSGVYNTADECFVASEIFNKDDDYRRLHSICSPNQLMRKKLFYMAFGVIPYFYTISTDSLAHNDMHELFHTIPDVLFADHTWQSEDSANGRKTREERMPEKVLNK